MDDSTWRPLAPDAIVARPLDDELVLYNDVTGSTHHLSVLGRLVMLAVLSHPCGISFQALVRHVADDSGMGGDDELVRAVARTLAGLAESRLITPAA